jgi:hypothetical protein
MKMIINHHMAFFISSLGPDILARELVGSTVDRRGMELENIQTGTTS